MEFTLTYKGMLKSNGKPDHKQEIRRAFHKQLKVLWSRIPLSEHHSLLQDECDQDEVDRLSVIQELAGFRFASLVSSKLHYIAELDIVLLRPEKPGQIVTQAGDIDNRLKTLFDALQTPKINQIPDGDTPQDNENPFYCLLEDDNLISRLSVDTRQLLSTEDDSSYVELIMFVKIKRLKTTFGNLF